MFLRIALQEYAICFISFLEKPGECPVPTSQPCAISALSNVCESDFDCNGASKCCQDKCGSSVCVGPTNGKIMILIFSSLNDYCWFCRSVKVNFQLSRAHLLTEIITFLN